MLVVLCERLRSTSQVLEEIALFDLPVSAGAAAGETLS